MSKYPVVRQHDAMDCGAACAKMIAKFYGKEFALSYLRTICYTVKDGVSLMSINDTLETLGFKTIGGKVSLNNLKTKALLPCILHWESNHFVVLFAVKKSKFGKRYTFIVGDPGMGIITLSEEEFVKKWISTVSRGQNSFSNLFSVCLWAVY
ncbi:MAG: ABC transporter [Dysgonamonadaceae bacterium]|jgi:ATP-binding cassette subfamily B protein|nr:ABC transporter [Dysgonamonadaceae bacterium]